MIIESMAELKRKEKLRLMRINKANSIDEQLLRKTIEQIKEGKQKVLSNVRGCNNGRN